jgi:hypothetical protein
MATFVAAEFERFFAGRPLVRQVTASMLPTMAGIVAAFVP